VLKKEIGAGINTTRARKGGNHDKLWSTPFMKGFWRLIEGYMNFRNTKAMPETKTLTHHGHETSRSRMDSSFLVIFHLSRMK
jgi:hypothetical protein